MPSIYVASLADYNAGIHHGTWIDCLEGPDHVRCSIDALLAGSPAAAKEGRRAEEWAIHDHEGFEGITISEFEEIGLVCALAEAVNDEGEPFAVFWENTVPSGADFDNALEQFQDSYQGTYRSLEDWAEEYAESTGMLDSIPENLRYYFDFERFARDCEINGDISSHDVSDGVAVFNRY